MNFNVKIIIFHLTVTYYSYSKLGGLRFLGLFPTDYYGCEALVTTGTNEFITYEI
jgi:hypothetical protein